MALFYINNNGATCDHLDASYSILDLCAGGGTLSEKIGNIEPGFEELEVIELHSYLILRGVAPDLSALEEAERIARRHSSLRMLNAMRVKERISDSEVKRAVDSGPRRGGPSRRRTLRKRVGTQPWYEPWREGLGGS